MAIAIRIEGHIGRNVGEYTEGSCDGVERLVAKTVNPELETLKDELAAREGLSRAVLIFSERRLD